MQSINSSFRNVTSTHIHYNSTSSSRLLTTAIILSVNNTNSSMNTQSQPYLKPPANSISKRFTSSFSNVSSLDRGKMGRSHQSKITRSRSKNPSSTQKNKITPNKGTKSIVSLKETKVRFPRTYRPAFTAKPMGTSHRSLPNFEKSTSLQANQAVRSERLIGNITQSTVSGKNDIESNVPKPRVKRMYGETKKDHTQKESSFAVTLYDDNKPYCSGTILNHDTILTAGHCVVGKDVRNITVGIASPNKESQTKIKILSVHPHSKFPTEGIRYINPDEGNDYNNTVAENHDDDYNYGDDYEEDYNYDDSTLNDVSIVSDYKVASEYDLALIKVKNGIFSQHNLSFIPLPTFRTLNTLKLICLTERKIIRTKLWAIGSGVTGNLEQNSTKHVFTKMTSGFLQLSPKCIDNTTIYVNFDQNSLMNSIWCRGDSGAGVYKIHHKTKRAALVGIIRSANAIGGHCTTHPNLLFGNSTMLEGRATLLTEDTMSFFDVHLSTNKGLTRWDGILDKKK